MGDPFTLAAIGGVALAEGIKFLYSQAGEVLKRRRQRREAEAATGSSVTPTEPAPAVTAPEGLLEGGLSGVTIDPAAVERLEDSLRALRRALGDYAEGIEPVDPGNAALLQAADTLRRLLEAVYGQRITFKGEPRPASGPVVEAKIDIDEVAGDAAAVRARIIEGGALVRAEARAERVERGATFRGVDADRIGP